MDNNFDDIISRLGSSPKEVLNQLFKSSQNFGPKKFPGKVVDNNDPLKLGRCRIKVYGVFDGNIPDSDIPWAIPESSFVGSSVGNFIVPPVDSVIWVHFDDGEITSPIYSTKVLDSGNMSSYKNEDYPNTMVFFELEDGDYLKHNKFTRETFYQHNSGTIIKIDAFGNVTLDATGTVNVNAPIIQTPAGTVTPLGTGGLCAMPLDPLTGLPQTGTTLVRQG